MLNKKDIPLELRKAIEPMIRENLDIIKPGLALGSLYFLNEVDENSKNYFKIESELYEPAHNPMGFQYFVESRPYHPSSNQARKIQASLETTIKEFQRWVNTIRELNEMPGVFDDHFGATYEKYFQDEMKMTDEDANYAPFTPDKQGRIEQMLLMVAKEIKETQEDVSEENREELLIETEEIIKALPVSTKNQIIKRIGKFFSKLYPQVTSAAKFILTEVSKNVIKHLTEGGMSGM